MTECLYYDQSYLTRFDARILQCEACDGLFHVVLDRTAFYPTSGGQPNDTGTLGGARVLDVFVDAAHVVHHVVEAALPVGACVHGQIDWARRFDHMQQHAADHMIAGKVWSLYKGYTVGLHLGQAFSTIDIIMPDGSTHLGDDAVTQIERLVNLDIQADLPVKCFFPAADELQALPLRKQPTVDEHIRVVMIGDQECVACGGTHVSSAGQIGLIKILWTAPSRGKLRLAFVAGMRAMVDYQARHQATERASALLSTTPAQLPDAVGAALEKLRALELELSRVKRQQALDGCETLMQQGEALPGGWIVVSQVFEDMDMDTMKVVAKKLIERGRVIALLALKRPDGVSILFARSEGGTIDMGALLSDAAKQFGGKGGGRPDFAQGAAASPDALGYAKEKLNTLNSICP